MDDAPPSGSASTISPGTKNHDCDHRPGMHLVGRTSLGVAMEGLSWAKAFLRGRTAWVPIGGAFFAVAFLDLAPQTGVLAHLPDVALAFVRGSLIAYLSGVLGAKFSLQPSIMPMVGHGTDRGSDELRSRMVRHAPDQGGPVQPQWLQGRCRGLGGSRYLHQADHAPNDVGADRAGIGFGRRRYPAVHAGALIAMPPLSAEASSRQGYAAGVVCIASAYRSVLQP